jgi:hypothetical protein
VAVVLEAEGDVLVVFRLASVGLVRLRLVGVELEASQLAETGRDVYPQVDIEPVVS